VIGADNRQTLVVKAALADVLRMENELPEAEKICHEALGAERRVMGPDHSDTLVTQNAFGQILREEHRYPEAESVLLDTLARLCLANCNFASHRACHNVTSPRCIVFISKAPLILAKHRTDSPVLQASFVGVVEARLERSLKLPT
jgi:hypothetical protein